MVVETRIIARGEPPLATRAYVAEAPSSVEAWRDYWTTRDPRVRNELALFYLPIVRVAVGRLPAEMRAHWDGEDLESFGLLGLLDAIDRFESGSDPRLFPAYAHKRVRGSVYDELRRLDWLPRSVRSQLFDGRGGVIVPLRLDGNLWGMTVVRAAETELEWPPEERVTFFRTLGVTPALGRLIDDRDLDPAAPPAVVLSHALWLRAFGSDSTIIGRTLSLSGIQRTVIGVTSASFAPPARRPELWTPLDLRPILASRAAENKMFQAAARLAPGVSVVQAQSELNLMSKTADTQSLDSRAIRAILSAVPIRDAMVGDVRPILLVVMGAALLVLLLACVNVAGLFLARASARQREMAVRAALGAGRWRLARQTVRSRVLQDKSASSALRFGLHSELIIHLAAP